MKSFVLKVIGITLLAIFALAALTYAAFAIFSPSSLASFYDGIGDYNHAVNYAYGNYERTNEKSDLLTVCRFALKTSDDKKIEKYLGMMIEGDFKAYCDSDEALGDDLYTFITGKYVVSLYRVSDDKTKACDRADELTENYSEACALRALLFETVKCEDKISVVYIKGKIDARAQTATGEEKELLEYDAANATEYLK